MLCIPTPVSSDWGVPWCQAELYYVMVLSLNTDDARPLCSNTGNILSPLAQLCSALLSSAVSVLALISHVTSSQCYIVTAQAGGPSSHAMD